jgi:two-component system sensor histidine kinase DesK
VLRGSIRSVVAGVAARGLDSRFRSLRGEIRERVARMASRCRRRLDGEVRTAAVRRVTPRAGPPPGTGGGSLAGCARRRDTGRRLAHTMRAMDRTADPVSGRRPGPAGRWQRGHVMVYGSLVALIGPVRDVVGGRTRSTWLAAAALAAFIACFALIAELGRPPGSPGPRLPVSPLRARLIGPLLASLVALAIAATLGFGRDWLVLFVFVAASAAFTVPIRWATAAIVAAAGVAVGTLLAVDGRAASASASVAWALSISMTGCAALLVRRRGPLIHELRAAHGEVARLAAADAVLEERLRFARDLHDLLGHSLSVIALKAELARELLDHDAERAQTEVAELEHVARRALDEVREAVSGYRARTLDGELDRAQGALEAAGVEVRTSVVVAGLPPAIDDLLARVVREAVTHIVRHSQAQRAEISLTAAGGVVHLEVSNDGAAAGAGDPAPDGEPDGGGLPDMRERVAAAGGRLTMVAHDGGVFRITAVVPLAVPAARREREAAR